MGVEVGIDWEERSMRKLSGAMIMFYLLTGSWVFTDFPNQGGKVGKSCACFLS